MKNTQYRRLSLGVVVIMAVIGLAGCLHGGPRHNDSRYDRYDRNDRFDDRFDDRNNRHDYRR